MPRRRREVNNVDDAGALKHKSPVYAPLPQPETDILAQYKQKRLDYHTRAKNDKFAAAMKREVWKDDDYNTEIPGAQTVIAHYKNRTAWIRRSEKTFSGRKAAFDKAKAEQVAENERYEKECESAAEQAAREALERAEKEGENNQWAVMREKYYVDEKLTASLDAVAHIPHTVQPVYNGHEDPHIESRLPVKSFLVRELSPSEAKAADTVLWDYATVGQLRREWRNAKHLLVSHLLQGTSIAATIETQFLTTSLESFLISELPDRDVTLLLKNLSHYKDCSVIRPCLKRLQPWFTKTVGAQVAELICCSSWLAMLDLAPDRHQWAGRGIGEKRVSLSGNINAMMIGKKLLSKARQNLHVKETREMESNRQAIQRLKDTRQQHRLWMNRSEYKEKEKETEKNKEGDKDRHTTKQAGRRRRRRSSSSSSKTTSGTCSENQGPNLS